MRQERIQKTTVRRRTRSVESQPLVTAPGAAPDLSDVEALLAEIDAALAAC